FDDARSVVGFHRQAGDRIGRDLGVARAYFAPRELAVAIGIQAECEIQIAQGDVPMTAYAIALQFEREITVGRLVRRSHRRGTQEKQGGKNAPAGGDRVHRSAWTCCSSCRSTTLCTPFVRIHCSAGAAATASRAASDASSNTRASATSRCTAKFDRASASARV